MLAQLARRLERSVADVALMLVGPHGAHGVNDAVTLLLVARQPTLFAERLEAVELVAVEEVVAASRRGRRRRRRHVGRDAVVVIHGEGIDTATARVVHHHRRRREEEAGVEKNGLVVTGHLVGLEEGWKR